MSSIPLIVQLTQYELYRKLVILEVDFSLTDCLETISSITVEQFMFVIMLDTTRSLQLNL